MNKDRQRGATVVGMLIVISVFGLAVGVGARALSSSASQTYCGQGRAVATIPGGGDGSETMSAPCGEKDVARRPPGAGEPSAPSGGAATGNGPGPGQAPDIGQIRQEAIARGPFGDGRWDARTGLVYEPGTQRVWDPKIGEIYDRATESYSWDDEWIEPKLAADPSAAPPRPPIQGFGTLEAWEPRWYDNPYAAGALNGLGVTAVSDLLGMAGWEGAAHFARDVTVAADRPEGRDTEFLVLIVSLAADVFTGGSRTAARGAAKGATHVIDDVPLPAAPPGPPRPTAAVAGAGRLAPDLRTQVDDLAAQGDYFVIPHGADKSGLIDYLRVKPVEYAVVRSSEDGLLYVVRGEEGWVLPRSPKDRLIFHNHPNNIPIISGVMRSTPDQFGKGDWGWIVGNRPQQRSTIIGTESGTFRQTMPRSWEMFEWDSVAGRWRTDANGMLITRQPRLDRLVIGGTMARDPRTAAYFHMLDAFERGQVSARDARVIQDVLMDGTRLARTELNATEAVYLGYAHGERVGRSIVARLENGVEIRFNRVEVAETALQNPLGVERYHVEVRAPNARPRLVPDVEVILDGQGKLLDVQMTRSSRLPPAPRAGPSGPAAPVLDAGRGSQYRSDAIDMTLAETFAQPVNPVLLPAARLADSAALLAGGGQIADGQLMVNGRQYRLDGEGVLAPIGGPGVVELDRDSYRALGVYNELGQGTKAESVLDGLDIREPARRRALGVHDLNAGSP